MLKNKKLFSITAMFLVCLFVSASVFNYAGATDSAGDSSTLSVEVDIKYYILDTSQQEIKLTIKNINGQTYRGLYVYYETDEALKRGENYKGQQYEKNSEGFMVPVNTDYSGLMGTQTEGDISYKNFRTKLSNTKFHYIITSVYYGEISPNDSSKILKTSEFTTMEPYKQTQGDLEIINNSFIIDYLQGAEYAVGKTRELYYAKVGFKYFNDIKADFANRKVNINSIKNITTNKTINFKTSVYGLYRYESQAAGFLTKEEFGNFFVNGDNSIECILDTTNVFAEKNETNNNFIQIITLSNVVEVPDSVVNVDGAIKSPGIRVEDSSGNTVNNNATDNNNAPDNNDNEDNNETSDDQIQTIQSRAKNLYENKIEVLLGEIKELRNIVKEQQVQIKYLASLKKDVKQLSEKVENAINNFITYGVDDNTKKLGEGERAAVIYSYKAAFDKLPTTEEELSDTIKIANGRWPSKTSKDAEKEAKEQFKKIYQKVADMNNPNDNAAVTVMAYGLRQRAKNRNPNSEKAGIKIFKGIYGHNPSSTEDWNMMQAITYSGASRGKDSDGDLLTDEREAQLKTDPKKPDTDGDGYKDGEEVANGYDPLKK